MNPEKQPIQADTPQQKQPYHKPVISDYGSLAQLTRTSAITSPTSDNGVFPNSYAS